MTDKAIAPTKIKPGSNAYFSLLGAAYGYNFLVGDEYRQMQEYSKKVWDAAQAQPAQPDCRTCDNLYRNTVNEKKCAFNEHSILGCTNGDKYEAAPRVVLWRTES